MIKLRYLAHSSFLVSCGQTNLVFDPWLKGPAYYGQWHLWPLPADDAENIQANAILITHGHEDHLHPSTLRAMDKNAHIFVPYQWRAGIRDFLRRIGYSGITEAVSFRSYSVSDVRVIYISFSLESVVIIEYAGEVLVNINDALNSNHENAVNFILKEINTRWPRIDYLLSGWSGASYFPNQVRYPGKNDIEIGKLREQYFANNFCRFTQFLKPKYAIPFAPGFVLLERGNQWINHVKFPRTILDSYYRTHYTKASDTRFLVMFPGDMVVEGEVEKHSSLHDIGEDRHYERAYRHYEKEISETEITEIAHDAIIDKLVNSLGFWMNHNAKLYQRSVLEDATFSIQLSDTRTNDFLNITFTGRRFRITRAKHPIDNRRLLVRTTAKKLLIGLSRVWGGDVLTIGYGIVVEVYDQLTLEKNLDIVCIRLITRYPIASEDLFKYPWRAVRFYSYNPRLTTLWLRQKIELKPYVNKYPYNERDHWLTYSKCDLCKVCKMPEVELPAL